MARFTSETALASLCRRWLHDQGWTTYAEVELRGLAGRPDLVGVRGPLTLVMECKLTASLSVVEQAVANEGRAHYVYVATPFTARRGMFDRVCRAFGVGWICIGGVQSDLESREMVSPRFTRRAATGWRARLRDEHATYGEPGSSGGQYWTPFRETCRNILQAVTKSPGVTTRELMDRTNHHYASSASARSAVYSWAKAGKIPGVRIELDDRGVTRWHPA